MAPGDAARRWAGVGSLGAGLLHAGLSPEHFAEWYGYGAFFVVAAVAQVVLGIALLSDAFRARDAAPHAAAWDRRMLVAGVVGNALLVLLYLISRTVGVPWLGPEAGEVEPIGAIDVLTKVLEAVAVVALLVVLHGAREPGRSSRRATS